MKLNISKTYQPLYYVPTMAFTAGGLAVVLSPACQEVEEKTALLANLLVNTIYDK